MTTNKKESCCEGQGQIESHCEDFDPFCRGYDTATAKAREELEELQDLKEWWEKRAELAERTLANLLAHQPLDSARDKQTILSTAEEDSRTYHQTSAPTARCGCDETSCGFHKAQDALDAMGAPTAEDRLWSEACNEAAKLREVIAELSKRLYHQPLDPARDKQPSMIRRNPNEDHRAAQQPCASCGRDMHLKDLECPNCGVKQPNAPDVEKKCDCPDPFSFGHEPGCALLVEAKAIRKITESAWQDVRERIISYDSFEVALRPHFEQFLDQARAPLVSALEDIAWGGNRPVDELRSIASAALTGTAAEADREPKSD